MSDVPARVLIVDDDPMDGELTQRRLAKLEAEVVFHQGPEGAVEAIANGDYGVVVLDLQMPGISGLQILNTVKTQMGDTKVLLYSSMTDDALAQIAESAGVSHLTKSASKAELIERVQALLQS